MGALKVHHTETEEGSWDGPANEARLKTEGSEAYYRSAFAWQDPEGDPETKAAYKFIHHFVGADGSVGAASTRAASAGIAVLNGGRGGTTIPSGDRQGVYNHLAAHLKDAEKEAPELSGAHAMRPYSEGEEVERRTFAVREMRASKEGEAPQISGYAAVFNSLSENLFGFRERIQAGAFGKSLEAADVRALWNHNSDYVLGRTKSGTLVLTEDEIGLRFTVRPPETQWAKDLLTTIRRGDVDQMSFGFITKKDRWEQIGEQMIRTLEEVELFDVSPVTYPAYPQTSAFVRSKAQEASRRQAPEDNKELEEQKAQARKEALRKIRLNIKKELSR